MELHYPNEFLLAGPISFLIEVETKLFCGPILQQDSNASKHFYLILTSDKIGILHAKRPDFKVLLQNFLYNNVYLTFNSIQNNFFFDEKNGEEEEET